MLKGLPKSRTSGWIAQKRFESLRKESEDDSSSLTSSDEFFTKRNSSERSSSGSGSGSGNGGSGPGAVNRRQKRVRLRQRKTAKPMYHPFYGKIYYPTDDDDSDEDCEINGKPRRIVATSFSTAPLHHRQPSHTAVSFAENLSSNDENYEPEDEDGDDDDDAADDEIMLSDRSFSSFESENPIQSLSRALSSTSRSGSSSAGSSASEAKQEKRVVLLPLVDNDLFTTERSPKKALLWSSSEEIEDFSDSN